MSRSSERVSWSEECLGALLSVRRGLAARVLPDDLRGLALDVEGLGDEARHEGRRTAPENRGDVEQIRRLDGRRVALQEGELLVAVFTLDDVVGAVADLADLALGVDDLDFSGRSRDGLDLPLVDGRSVVRDVGADRMGLDAAATIGVEVEVRSHEFS